MVGITFMVFITFMGDTAMLSKSPETAWERLSKTILIRCFSISLSFSLVSGSPWSLPFSSSQIDLLFMLTMRHSLTNRNVHITIKAQLQISKLELVTHQSLRRHWTHKALKLVITGINTSWMKPPPSCTGIWFFFVEKIFGSAGLTRASFYVITLIYFYLLRRLLYFL